MKTFTRILLVLGVAAMATSCASQRTVYVEPAPPPPPPATVVMVSTIPIAPPALVITTGPGSIRRPASGYVWIDGFWYWDYFINDYVWQNGYWTRLPFSNAIWVPGFWESRGMAGYVWVHGSWLPRGASITFGLSNTRFDYWGRPVYYAQPARRATYVVFNYDNRPQYSGRSFSSNAAQNNRRSTSAVQDSRGSSSRRDNVSTTPSRSTSTTNTNNSLAT